MTDAYPERNHDREDITDENDGIRVVRIRHFFEFESLAVINHIEEITFYNSKDRKDGKNTTLHYLEPDFKHYLNIFDNNGEKLQFHGYLEDYFEVTSREDSPISTNYKEDVQQSTNQDNENDVENIPFEILIDFPENRPILKDEFRTIFLHDKLDCPLHVGFPTLIDIQADNAVHFYVYVKKLPYHNATIDKAFYDRSEPEKFFRLEESEEKEFLGDFETTSYYCAFSFAQIEGCNLRIAVDYSFNDKDRMWYYSGLSFGTLAIVLNAFFLINHIQDSLTHIAQISTIVITYLVVTKGWIITKGIEDVIHIRLFNKPLDLSLSFLYILLICIIFIELCFSLFFGYKSQNEMSNFTLVIQSIYQRVYML